jgi:hypothetical protein
VVAGESRAAAAYVVAGLCAEGSTRIVGTEHLERVYSDLADKLRSLGVDITELPTEGADDGSEAAEAPARPLPLGARLNPITQGAEREVAAAARANGVGHLPLAATSNGEGSLAGNGHIVLPPMSDAPGSALGEAPLSAKPSSFGILPTDGEDA